MNGASDTDLLSEFAQRRCDAAFNELVRRHISLVYSAALRIVVDAQLAEDVTQGVFVVLAKDAAEVLRKVRAGAPLSGWLHVTTRNIAAKTVRAQVRRRAREKEAASMRELECPDGTRMWEQIAPHLDTALASLRDHDRTLLLLRFFEQKSLKELTAQFGAGEDAIQKRVSRALESLRRALTRRGVNVPGGALAALLSAHALQAAPVSLVTGITAAAVSSTAMAGPGMIAAGMKAIGGLTMTKSQFAATAALLAGLAGPIYIQQSTLRGIRPARPTTAAQPVSAQASLPAEPQVSTGMSELEEIGQLRRRAADLRARLAAQKAKAVEGSQPEEPSKQSQAGPLLLAVGKPVSVFDLVHAGTATPEAALQSLLTLTREGDIGGMMAMTALPPEGAREMAEALANKETRELFSERLRKGLFGAVMSERVERREDGSTSEPVVQEVWPQNPDQNVSIEIVNVDPIDEKRVRINAKIVRGTEARTDSYMFGHTSSGWKNLWR